MLRKKLVLLLLTVSPAIFAQESTPENTTPANEPVKKTFENGVVVDDQTIEGPSKKGLDFMIQHRFGTIVDERNLYGIFAPANIRLGLCYGITKRFSVGFGATKNKHLYDLEWKYILLKQTKPSGMPISVAYFGNVLAQTGENKNFINQKKEYTFANRCTFFHELMIARKFNDHISAQVAGSYTYLNFVPDSTLHHGLMGLSVLARYKFTVMSSVQVGLDYPLNPDKYKDATGKSQAYQKPNLFIGYEVSTGQHQFQIFVTTSDGITGQQIIGYNTNDFTKKHNMLIGFNITRQFDF